MRLPLLKPVLEEGHGSGLGLQDELCEFRGSVTSHALRVLDEAVEDHWSSQVLGLDLMVVDDRFNLLTSSFVKDAPQVHASFAKHRWVRRVIRVEDDRVVGGLAGRC